ncbi:serine/threonine protein kinase [Bifidobacterium margollesii]|uniref:non-specific serine/threonine protein kinase n=1 Tax=Bifidobacterium margollesii TaxID=2020964 RepID=A0A2N5JAA6_9BIFI|nr:serine/threonine protein kinase [Bifidobacterium margollesii]
MRLVEGQLIHRRYRLDQRLAQGGMGEVWKGYDIELERPVAIKALRGDLPNEEAKLRRLRTEAHNSANLAHPNIAALFEYYEHDNIGFLIMEYVPNQSLAEIYKERAPLEATELLPILIQTARGLYVAHSHGVIHRDVKPANIMVSESGEVKITDFGVSYSTNQAQITQDGMVVGTAQYISPEQAQGEHATPQSDIYSLGVVAYEGLCGHRPFTGATPVDIAAAHVNDPVPPLPTTIDWQLREFVMTMLAKDPQDRPVNALVVSRTLAKIERRLLDQQTIQAAAMNNPDGTPTRTIASKPHRPLQFFSAADWAAKIMPETEQEQTRQQKPLSQTGDDVGSDTQSPREAQLMAQLEALETQAQEISQMGRNDDDHVNALAGVAPEDETPDESPSGSSDVSSGAPEIPSTPEITDLPDTPDAAETPTVPDAPETPDAPRVVIDNDLNNNESTERGVSR